MSATVKPENLLLVQVRIIVALVLRETRVAFGNAQLGYLWALANPALGVAALVLVFSLITHAPPLGTSFALFFATGILPYEMNRKLSTSLMAVFSANKGLLAYPLVKETDLIFARFILIFATYLMVMFLFFTALVLIGEGTIPARIDQVFLAILMSALLGLGGGVSNAVIFGLWPTWQQIEAIFSRPLFFMSGIFFIPSAFGPEVRAILQWNPLLHCIEWMREGYYPNYQSVLLDKPFLFACIGVLLMIGFGGERLYRKRLS
ncbi:MAG: ABC transporter permease [Rhizobiales bacterium]|nr:ABC transporter permease [Hyphomicrobiales bacterium]